MERRIMGSEETIEPIVHSCLETIPVAIVYHGIYAVGIDLKPGLVSARRRCFYPMHIMQVIVGSVWVGGITIGIQAPAGSAITCVTGKGDMLSRINIISNVHFDLL